MSTYDSFVFTGHGVSEANGSYDPGATAQGVKENDLAQLFVNEAKAELSTNSSTKNLVIHYDEQNYVDCDLKGNVYRAKCGVTVHINAGGGTGSEIWVPCKESSLEHDFNLVSDISNVLGITNRGVKSRDYDSENTIYRTIGQAVNCTDYYKEIREAWNQGISLAILEVGFIDTSDLQKMQSKVREIGFAIAKYIAACNGISLSSQSTNKPTPPPSSNTSYYRVRKTWGDASSQIGAFKELQYAKDCAVQNPGYSVFDSSGNKIYPIVNNSVETEQNRYTKYGTFTTTVTEGIYFYNEPRISTITGSYEYEESVNYDLIVETNKYKYISWVSASAGVRRYMPVVEKSSGDVWGSGV